MSGATLFKCVVQWWRNCQWRSEPERSGPRTESQGLRTVSNSVVFTEVQCGSLGCSYGLQNKKSVVRVTIGRLRPTRVSVEAFRTFPFLDNDATMNGFVRELPQYIAATEMGLLNATEEKLMSTKRGFLIGLLQSRKSCLLNLRLLPQKEF